MLTSRVFCQVGRGGQFTDQSIASTLYDNTEASRPLLESGARKHIKGKLELLSIGSKMENDAPGTVASNHLDIIDGLSGVEYNT